MLLGNEAIARGLVEAGCDVLTAYPGTPSSEILPAAAAFADELGTKTVIEWGANEKVAMEIALGATFAGKRACAVMKQVGLNVAMDPFMSAAHFQLEGGMVVIVSDDPGCHASQDDQDSRGLALFAKVPCFDPAGAEARALVERWRAHITRHYYDCTPEILKGLGQMYTADERFTAYMDRFGDGTAAFLSAAIAAY